MRWLYRVPWVRGALLLAMSCVFRARHRRSFAPGVRIYGWPLLRLKGGSVLHVGTRASLISVSEFSEWALNHACHIRTTSPSSEIVIGDDVGMSGVTIVCADRIEIGDRVMLGANVCMTDTDSHVVDLVPRRFEHSQVKCAPVRIQDDVFVGAGTIVLKGVTIGEGSVIGAGSVVASDIPAGVVAAGNPARVIRQVRLESRQ